MTNYRWAGVTAASNEWSSEHGKRRIVIFGNVPLLMEKKTKKALRGKKGRKLHEMESLEKPLGERKGKKFLKEERVASLIEGD